MELVEDKRARRPFPRERNVGTICAIMFRQWA